MPRKLLPLAFLLAALFAWSALPTCLVDLTTGSTPQADVSQAGNDVPLELSGVDDLPAHPTESSRRITAPERWEAPVRPVVDSSAAVSKSATSALGRRAVQTAAPTDSTVATPLHLRHCVFLC